MSINLYLLVFLIILGALLSFNDGKRNRVLYIIICSAVLVFVAAMRSPEWMTYTYNKDTLNYQSYFENYRLISWGGIVQELDLRYVKKVGEGDVGFIVLSKIIGLFTESFYVFSLIADLIFFIPFGILLYRYCAHIWQLVFSYVFYVAMVQTFLLAGARQVYAIGFEIMALLAMMDGKKLRSLMFFILGMSIHFSSLLFLIPLLAIWIDVRPNLLKAAHLICFAAFPFVFLFPNELIMFMGNAAGLEKYAEYGQGDIQGGANTFIILIEFLSLFCLIAIRRKHLIGHKSMNQLYVMAPLFTLFAPLIQSNGSMIRISLFFHLFLVILVPYAIECMFGRKGSSFIYLGAIAALSVLTLVGGGMKYYFFWQY